MGKIAIVTDSNSGITQDEGRELGVSVLPMPFYINDVMYLEGITLSQEEFYERLKNDETISTSQPSPAEVCGLWDNLLKEYDEVVHIPMSSGLSASCDTATMLARDYDGKVEVVNNQRISVTQRQSVLDALALRAAGKTAAEIKTKLEEEKMESSIYITLETLKYLKKGGRITPAAAAIGTVTVLIVFPVVAVLFVLVVTAGLALEYLRAVSVRASVYLICSCGWKEDEGDNRRYLFWAVICVLICFAASGFTDLSTALGYYLAWNIQVLWPWMMAGGHFAAIQNRKNSKNIL